MQIAQSWRSKFASIITACGKRKASPATLAIAAAISLIGMAGPQSPALSKTLSGGVQTSAIMPAAWSGRWQGNVALKALAGQTSVYQESTASITLALEVSDNGKSTVKQLLVSNVHENDSNPPAELRTASGSGADDGNPDIIFEHQGNHSMLTIKNGASVHVNGDMIVGGPPGSVATVQVGGSSNDAPGANGGLAPQAPSRGQAANYGTNGDAINYNNGGIIFGGPTTFNDRHFRADDALAIAPKSALINAGRIDIDGKTVHPGRAVEIEGNHAAGFMISDLGTTQPLGAGQASAAENAPGPVQFQILGASQKLLKNELQQIAANIIGQQTMVPLYDASGQLEGYQQTSVRYTAAGLNRMLVQIGINNYSPGYKLTKQFTLSGYLDRIPGT